MIGKDTSAIRSAFVRSSLSLSVSLLAGTALYAQTSPQAAPSDLPAVTVAPPVQRNIRVAPRPARVTRAVSVPQRAVNRQRAPIHRTAVARRAVLQPAAPIAENPTGPAQGYVATRSLTGTKTNTEIMENPQSISVVARQQIEQQGSLTVAESLRYTSGVLAGSRPGNRFDDVFIRGFGGFGFTAGYVQFLDGLKMQRGVSYAVPNVDAYGLERIEVIKGPASVLYGQSNPGGIINMVSKRPTEKAFGEAELQIGNYDRKQVAFDMGGPVDKDGRWLYRLTGLGLDSNTSVNFTEQQRIYIAPALTWKPDNDTKLTILAKYQNDPKSFQPNYLPAQGLLPGIPGVPANPYGKLPTSFYIGDPSHDSYKRELLSVGYEFEHRLSNTWTVRQNVRYQHLTSEFYAIPANPGYANTADPNQIQRAKTSVDEQFGGIVLDNQAEANFDTGFIRHKVLFGVDYQYNSASRLLGQAKGVPALSTLNPLYYQNIARAAFQTNQHQRSSQLGGYVQDQMKIDRLTISLAGRYDISNIRFDTLTFANGARSIVDQNDRQGTYRAGAIYQFDNGLAPFVNYATSFEPAPYLAFGDKPLQPMRGRQYEFGVKYQPFGYNALLTASYFDIRQQNVINGDVNHVGYYVQTGEVSSRGFEFEAKATVFESLNLIASLTLLDAKVTKDITPLNVGKRPFSVPDVMASAWADYTIQTGALRGLGFGGGVRYIGDSAGDPANSFFVPEVTLVDAALRYDFGNLSPQLKGWSARINANNLFDREYVSACYTLSNGCFWGGRRSIVGALKFTW
jgi:iron complex outermembrane receptor protein